MERTGAIEAAVHVMTATPKRFDLFVVRSRRAAGDSDLTTLEREQLRIAWREAVEANAQDANEAAALAGDESERAFLSSTAGVLASILALSDLEPRRRRRQPAVRRVHKRNQ